MEDPTESHWFDVIAHEFSESEDRVMGSSPQALLRDRQGSFACIAPVFARNKRGRGQTLLRITPYTEFVACGRGVISSRYHPVIQSPRFVEKF